MERFDETICIKVDDEKTINDFMIPLNSDFITESEPSYDITECLEENQTEQPITGAIPCDRCNCIEQTLKQTITRLPPILVINFKRFEQAQGLVRGFGHRVGNHQKDNSFIKFPLSGLRMNPYVHDGDESKVYDCYAVTNHEGTLT